MRCPTGLSSRAHALQCILSAYRRYICKAKCPLSHFRWRHSIVCRVPTERSYGRVETNYRMCRRPKTVADWQQTLDYRGLQDDSARARDISSRLCLKLIHNILLFILIIDVECNVSGCGSKNGYLGTRLCVWSIDDDRLTWYCFVEFHFSKYNVYIPWGMTIDKSYRLGIIRLVCINIA